jgi:hypothetical protein
MNYRQFVVALISLLGLSACVVSVPMRLYQRPEIQLPSHIKRIGLLDHSQGLTDSVITDNQLIQMEATTNKVSSEHMSYAVNLGMVKEAKTIKDSLFEFVNLPFQLRRPQPDSFPPPLSSKLVESIGKQHKLDAILAIEYFEPVFRSLEGSASGNFRTMQGKAKIGWRVYDVRNQQILVEDIFVQQMEWLGKYWDDRQSENKELKERQEAIAKIAARAGGTLVRIICPTYEVDSRDIFVGKTGPNDLIAEQMEKAGELAQAQKWQEAMALWRPIASNDGLGKVAGRAAFNMAVGCEHLGDLDLALKWIEKASQTHQIDKAYDYMVLLNYRSQQ